MTARIETLREPRQVSPWLVIGTAAALIAALAVVTVSQPEVTPARGPAVESTERTMDLAEMAALKTAVAHEYMVERFGIADVVSSPASENAIEAAVKARLAHGYLSVQSLDRGPGSGSEKGHPVRRSG